MRAIGLEFKFKNAKDTVETHQSNTYVNCESDSDDEKKKIAELVWPSEAKSYSCS